MKPLLVVGGILALAGIAVLAYVFIAPNEDAPATSNAGAGPSATTVELKPPTPRPTAPRRPLVRPPASATALEIYTVNENEELINELGNYPNLEVLKIHCLENLQALPDAIGTLAKLRELDMDEGNGCSMNPAIPESIGNLSALEKLNLAGAQDPRDVTEHETRPRGRHKFPAGMSQMKNLTYLNLGRNGMPEVPPFVKDLPKLKVLDFSWNMEVKEIPLFLTNLQELTTLHLESDGLTDLPDFLKDLPKLQVLDFSWNMEVKQIPSFLTNLHELTTLRLDADGLTDLPDFLNKLPKLHEVSLGNNCSITQNPAKKQDLQRRFPRITFDFEDEYDCPQEETPATASSSK